MWPPQEYYGCDMKTIEKDLLITFPGCIRFSKFQKRWKALTLSFPTLFSDWKMDTTRQSYERFFLEGFHVTPIIFLGEPH